MTRWSARAQRVQREAKRASPSEQRRKGMNEMPKSNNLTVRDYMMIIECLDSQKRELEKQADRFNEPYPPEVEKLEELIEKIKNVTT